jgi:hypothetical protein
LSGTREEYVEDFGHLYDPACKARMFEMKLWEEERSWCHRQTPPFHRTAIPATFEDRAPKPR